MLTNVKVYNIFPLQYIWRKLSNFLFWVAQVDPSKVEWSKIYFENYELVEKGLRTNYFGTKELTRVLIPLLQCSSSPKIINVSSSIGRLKVRHT